MKTKACVCVLMLLFYWAPVLLPAAGGRAAAATVTSFMLVNADTDLDLFVLTPGIVLDFGSLPTQNLNIRANVDMAVGSVTFALSGSQVHAGTENVVPYALFSDVGGDYFAWTPPIGNYTLTATPFAAGGGTGTAGTPFTLSFSVVNTALQVASFTLVNADTDLDLFALTPGIVLYLNALPTQNLNIRANTSLAFTGSVVFSLSGAGTWASTENVPPYALFSDLLGDYFTQPLPPGAYSLTATPFDAPLGAGVAGSALTLAFSVVSGPLPVELTSFTAKAPTSHQVQLHWQTASEHNNREFEVQRSTNGQQFNVVGRMPGHGSTSAPHAYAYTDGVLPAQATTLYYRLRQVDEDGKFAFSPVRAVRVMDQKPAFAFFPTLAVDGWVQYAFNGPITGTEVLEVLTPLGQRCRQFALAPAGGGTLSLAGLPAGTYWLRLTSSLGSYTGRVVLP
ncbi:hypothetical protein [Hymenobacter sp. IS2118]|uniref:hypothetical protein n=1 Tax=Hymenobacter sp. IS2118 TaxID=1505605 RepID=UPI00068FFF3D|nr:hypothetical protein [Hymenobacter sp. IS2118]